MVQMHWERDAKKQLGRVPFFVRPLVKRKVEERVRDRGADKVTFADFQEAESRYRSVAAGKSEEDLKRMMPRENVPGVEMVVVETCHNELSNCPNVLIKTGEWKKAIEDWVRQSGVSERLRKRIKDDKILYHQKFRISISGCPNACSRPQIADLGITGFVRPEVDPAHCRFCGSCEEVCPDSAIEVKDAPPIFDRKACQGCTRCRDICPDKCISVSEPGARIMVGGKLGRHPRLAEVIGEVDESSQVIKFLDRIVNDYIEKGEPGERFADFWARTGKEKKR